MITQRYMELAAAMGLGAEGHSVSYEAHLAINPPRTLTPAALWSDVLELSAPSYAPIGIDGWTVTGKEASIESELVFENVDPNPWEDLTYLVVSAITGFLGEPRHLAWAHDLTSAFGEPITLDQGDRIRVPRTVFRWASL